MTEVIAFLPTSHRRVRTLPKECALELVLERSKQTLSFALRANVCWRTWRLGDGDLPARPHQISMRLMPAFECGTLQLMLRVDPCTALAGLQRQCVSYSEQKEA